MDLFIIIFYILLGLVMGVLTGLVPGLHPNTVSAILLALFFGDPLLVSVIMVSCAVANSFVDFIPSILLGAPDPETALGVLPGHRMMMEGRAYEAIRLTVMGGIASLLIILALLPPLAFLVGPFYEAIRPNIHWILIAIIIYMFWRDRSPWSVVVFGFAGALGYLVLNGGFMGSFALLPMLTGLFGLSTIINSIKTRVEIPEQSFAAKKVSVREMTEGGLTGSLSGILVGLLPGVGAAQATFLSHEILRDRSERKFMIAMGGVNTVVAIFSILALWLIGNPRSGIAVAVKNLLGAITFNDVIVLTGAVALAGGVSAALTLLMGRKLIGAFRKISYRKLSFFVAVFLLAMTFFFTGLPGILTLVLSTLIGMVCILSGTRRSYMMACLIVPTIMFFL